MAAARCFRKYFLTASCLANLRNTSSKLFRPTSRCLHLKQYCYQNQITTSSFHSGSYLYAGHSKWQNIRHIKAAKDRERMDINSKIVLKMNIAIREGGSADPKLNRQLERVIIEAESKDVPKSTIQNALKRANEKTQEGKMIYIEMKGPGNCFIIAEVLTNKATRTRQQMQFLLKPSGGRILDNGMTNFAFDYKGVIRVPFEGEEDMDTAMEHAIEAGAEEVQSVTDSSGNNLYEFHSDIKDVHKVSKHLESLGKTVTHSKREYIPTNYVKLNESELDLLSVFYDKLNKMDEPVLSIYDNVEAAVEE